MSRRSLAASAASHGNESQVTKHRAFHGAFAIRSGFLDNFAAAERVHGHKADRDKLALQGTHEEGRPADHDADRLASVRRVTCGTSGLFDQACQGRGAFGDFSFSGEVIEGQ